MKYHLLFFFIVCTEVLFALNVIPDLPNKKNRDLLFIENKGQITDFDGNPRSDILFILKANGVNVFIGKNSLHYVFSKCNQPEYLLKGNKKFKKPDEEIIHTQDKITYTIYRLDLMMQGTNSFATVKTGKPTEYYENYYNVPSQPNGITGVKSYEKITIENIYPGIDWILYIKDNKLKYDFVVHEGADYRQIKMQYRGANKLKLNADGSLLVSTSLGSITEDKPYTYKTNDRKEIFSQYTIDGSTVGFNAGNIIYGDFIIDPGIVWSTYYGGGSDEEGRATFTDASKNVFLAGITPSINNINSNAHQDTIGGNTDAFLVKFNDSGVRLWATYYGGSDIDEGYSVCTDASGFVYLAGATQSSTNIGYGGVHQDTLVGSSDAFLVKFSIDGIRQWGTYYGGTNWDDGYGVCTDFLGNVYLVGSTLSTTGISSGGHQNTKANTSRDAFLAKFNGSGTRQWGTYYGGTGTEQGFSVCTDKNANVYLAGYVTSRNLAIGAHQSTFGGIIDAILVKFNANGVRQWATYYGGEGQDLGFSTCSDKSGNVFLTGWTWSLTGISSNGHQNSCGLGNDAFLVKFDTNGTRLWGTYYGGRGDEIGAGVCADTFENVYLTGTSYSTSAVASIGYENSLMGIWNAFLVKFNYRGERLWGTYVGDGAEDGRGVSVDLSGNIYIAGTAHGGGVALGIGGHQLFSASYQDAFLMKYFPEKAIFGHLKQKVYCAGDSFLITFNKITKMDYGNSYTFQLSDTSGNFNNGTTVFVKVDSIIGADSIMITIPGNLNQSRRYKLRMVTSSPADTIYFQDSITINSKPIINININDTSQCLDKNKFVFTNNSIIDSGIMINKWSFGDNTTSDSISPQKLYSGAGNYLVKLVIASSLGCKDSVTQNISVNPVPVAGFSVNDSIQCLNTNEITFTNTSSISSGTLNYKWNFGDSTTSDSISPQKSYSGAGNYSAKLVVSSNEGCRDSIIHIITINPKPYANFFINDSVQCLRANTITFTNTSSVSSGFLNYVWQYGDADSSTSNSPIHKYKDTGNYTIILKVISDKNCLDSISKTIYINGHPQAVINEITNNVCFGDTAVFEVKNPSTQNKVQWLRNGIANTSDSLISLKSNFSGDLQLVLVNNSGCEDTSAKLNIVVYLKPVKPILSQSSLVLDAGMGYSTYLWYKNGQPISNSTAQTYNVTQNGSYHVLVTNNEGCQEWSDTISVTNVSVNEMINQDELNIYPNPSTGVFTLDFASIAPMKRVYLYDTKGNILYQQLTHENSLLLNVQHLPKGVYIVKILSEEDIYFSKLIIE